MSTLHLVDPELRPLLEGRADMAWSHENLPLIRSRTFPWPEVPAPGVSHQKRWAPGLNGAPDVGLEIYRASDPGPLPCIVHIHGGGYIYGTAADTAALHRPMAAELGCVLVSVDYRLAPEVAFPGNLEDCYAALAWVFAHADDLGIDADRIGVMGESAGGGLAAALALMARDRGEFPLAFQHLIYPMLDDRTGVAGEAHPTTGEFVWTAAQNRFGWACLLGHDPGGDGVSPYAAPARAGDLSGLPPTFISAGALDLFLEEDLEYARRLTRAGVAVELHVYRGAYHGFEVMTEAEITRRARRDSLEALGRALRG
jgi:acetyl esterase/lipase